MKRKWILTSLLLILTVQPVWAAKYVSDVLWVSLRTAADDNSESIRVLRSGTKLEILKEEETEGYVHVKTSKGEEGWIKSRYLMDNPIASVRVNSLEKQIKKLEEENVALKAQVDGVKKEDKETVRERKRMISENQKLIAENKKLKELAKNPMKLSEENTKLKTENETLLTENTKMKDEYTTIQDEGQRDWFIAGAGVLFTGIILGVIFPSLRFRRRSGWS